MSEIKISKTGSIRIDGKVAIYNSEFQGIASICVNQRMKSIPIAKDIEEQIITAQKNNPTLHVKIEKTSNLEYVCDLDIAGVTKLMSKNFDISKIIVLSKEIKSASVFDLRSQIVEYFESIRKLACVGRDKEKWEIKALFKENVGSIEIQYKCNSF